MANISYSEVKGIGKIHFTNPDGSTFTLHDVRYMPGMTRNMISMGTLEAKGCEFKGSEGILKVIKGCTVFMKGVRRASLYVLQAEAMISEPMAGLSEKTRNSDDLTRLWHNRLGMWDRKL